MNYRARADVYIMKLSNKGLKRLARGKMPKKKQIHVLAEPIRNTFRFPGGGIDNGESLVSGVGREVLEKIGVQLTKLCGVQGAGPVAKVYSEGKRKRKGAYGSMTWFFHATRGCKDTSCIGVAGDEMKNRAWLPVQKVMKTLHKSSNWRSDAQHHAMKLALKSWKASL